MTGVPLHGLRRPRWYVRLRGRWWLRSGFCPCCYSSPPLEACPVCRGHHEYGPRTLAPHLRELWAARWDELA